MSITTTASQIAAAVNAKCPDLVVVTNFAGNDGTGVVTAMPVVALAGGDANTAALVSIDPAGSNNKLTFTATAKGADGNKIKVLYVDPGSDDAALEVLLIDGRTIYVVLGTPLAPIGVSYATVDLVADTGYLNAEQDLLTVSLTLGQGTRGKVLLQFDGPIGMANQFQYANLRFVVDGVLQDNVATGLSPNNGTWVGHSMHEVVTGLAQGAHTFKVRISAPLNSVQAFAKGGQLATAQTRLTVLEL